MVESAFYLQILRFKIVSFPIDIAIIESANDAEYCKI